MGTLLTTLLHFVAICKKFIKLLMRRCPHEVLQAPSCAALYVVRWKYSLRGLLPVRNGSERRREMKKSFIRWVVLTKRGQPLDVYKLKSEADDAAANCYAKRWGPFTVEKIRCEVVK